jgi:RNA polymerase sigma-70 factor, ECF subfamily
VTDRAPGILIMPNWIQDATDEDLARQARAGSLECFESLVERYEGRLLRFLFQRTGNRHDSEDLTQAVFMAAWKGLARYDASRPFRPWLYTIAARQAISHARARRDFEPLTGAQEVACAPLAARDDGEGALWQLSREQLPEAQATALWLKYAENMTVNEIARVTGRTPVHVRVLLHRGRRTLAIALGKEPTS